MQQTRISQGLSYFNTFIDKFPTVHHLARAPIDAVLLVWQGLGYYSRARNMHQTAKIIVEQLHGVFPQSAQELQQLKGIGSYTAAAIASVCYNERIPAIDGNVNRVIARLFNIEDPIDKAFGKKQIEAYANLLIMEQNPGDFNQAMMDFGAMVCTPKQPACTECPLQTKCIAFCAGTHLSRPIKSIKTKVSERYFIYVLVSDGKHMLINKRKQNDIWNGLYELPLWEVQNETELQQWIQTKTFQELTTVESIEYIHEYKAPIHKLSHQNINARFIYIKCNKMPTAKQFQSIETNKIANYAFPRLIESYLVNQLTKYKNEVTRSKLTMYFTKI
jgi:A/G-specific adenine glycosylase